MPKPKEMKKINFTDPVLWRILPDSDWKLFPIVVWRELMRAPLAYLFFYRFHPQATVFGMYLSYLSGAQQEIADDLIASPITHKTTDGVILYCLLYNLNYR